MRADDDGNSQTSLRFQLFVLDDGGHADFFLPKNAGDLGKAAGSFLSVDAKIKPALDF